MRPGSGGLGSAAIGFALDLRGLQKDANKANGILSNMQKNAEKGGKGGGGGFLSNITAGADKAGFSLSLLSNFSGPVGRIGTAISGVSKAFSSLASSAGGAGATVAGGSAIAGVAAVALIALAAVIGTVIVAYQGLKLAASEAEKSLAAAGDQQALDTSFGVLSKNLGLSEARINGFRGELEKLDYTTAEQTQIMQKLTNALGSNGLSNEALQATKAMRDLSVVAGVSSKEGIDTMTNAVGSLNTEVLKQFGIIGTSTQHFERYGALIGKTADEMSNTEKQHAILNAVIEQGSRSMGAADAARNDFNRLLVRTKDNANQLRAAVGQMFLPLASGILSMINGEVLGLSKSADSNREKFQALGQKIASYVIPILQQFIGWLKTIPWDRVINGFLIAFQYARIFASNMILTAKVFYGAGQIIAGVMGIVGAAIYSVIKPIQVIAVAAAAMWDALRGKTSFGDAFKRIGDSAKAASQGMKNTWASAFKGIGSGFVTIGKAYVDFTKTTVNAINTIRNTDFKKIWEGLPKGLQEGTKEALGEFADTAEGMGEEGLKAARKLAEQLAKENADFARSQEKALRDYQESLAELVAQHRDQIASIKKDIDKETKNYEKATNERTANYEKQLADLAKADKDRKNDINTQLAEELAKGRFADKAKIASLRSRLAYEDSENKKAVAEVEANYQKETDAAKNSYDERIAELQASLDKELEIQGKHSEDFATYRDYQIKDDITKLKEKYALQKAEDERAHQERLADMIRQGKEQADQARANGNAEGLAGMEGLGAGLGAGAPPVLDLANEIGKNTGEETGKGIISKGPSVKDRFVNVMKETAAGAAVGTLFGPVGTAVGATVGAMIGASGGTVGGALRNMWNNAIAIMGNLREYGSAIMRKLGESIRDVLPGPVKGPFRSAWNGAGLPAFAQGGIVGGPAGNDNVLARVSAGEMVLNKAQQQRMFSYLDGKANFRRSGAGSGNITIDTLQVTLPGVQNASDFTRELKLKFATMRTI